MATNKSMIQILERTHFLIKNLNNPMKIEERNEMIIELQACGRVLRRHILAQKRQKGTDYKDKYVYRKDLGNYVRVYDTKTEE